MSEQKSTQKERQDGLSDDLVTQYSSALIDLPRELRRQIYDHLLGSDDIINIVIDQSVRERSPHDQSDVLQQQSLVNGYIPALSQVNRQLRSEVSSIWYPSKTFAVHMDDSYDLAGAKAWLEGIGDQNVGMMRHLVLCGVYSRTWYGLIRSVKISFDLKQGRAAIEHGEGSICANFPETLGRFPEDLSRYAALEKQLQHLAGYFVKMFGERQGEPFDVQSLSKIVDSFWELCEPYWA